MTRRDKMDIVSAVVVFCVGFLAGDFWSFLETREQSPHETAFDRSEFEFSDGDADPMCAAGDYSIWADLEKTALKTCNNGTVATLGPTSGLYFTPAGDTIYMYTRDGVKVEYTLSPEWGGEKS